MPKHDTDEIVLGGILEDIREGHVLAEVIAFRFFGRFNWIRRIFPARSVRISSMVDVLEGFE
jgi:hypothetical protein